MFKKLFITILLVFSLNGHAFAHTGLEKAHHLKMERQFPRKYNKSS